MNYTTYPAEKCDFYEIMPAVDLPNGERVLLELDDIPIVIFNIADEFYAVKDQCSHEDLELSDGDLEGYEIVCPYHGAHFDVRNGEVKTLPAVEKIPAFPVRVRDGNIELGLPKE
jgi:3-phenylpropionate/trans-cinnamate dioxygenase ferredoxin subunit